METKTYKSLNQSNHTSNVEVITKTVAEFLPFSSQFLSFPVEWPSQ